MAISKSILDAAKKLKPGESLMSIPGVTKAADADKAPITLDRMGVTTSSGQRSSDIDPSAPKVGTTMSAADRAKLDKIQSRPSNPPNFTNQQTASSAFNQQPELSGVEGFIANKVNPALQKALEFMGGEFTREEKGELKMTPKGAKTLITGAAIAGAVGPLIKYGGTTLAKVGVNVGGKTITPASRAATKASIKRVNASPGYINRQVFAHEYSTITGSLMPRGTKITQRAIIGKATTQSGVGKLFSSKIAGGAAKRYAVNPKSQAGTISMMRKAGMTLAVAGLVVTWAGTYPFARFELAEATDKLGMAMFKAAEAGDVEAVNELSEYMNEIVNPGIWGKIIAKIPFANVQRSVNKNIIAAEMSARIMLEEAERNLRIASGEEESQFQIERRLADEAAQARKDEQRVADEDYFNRLREESDQRKRDERKEQEDYYSDIRAQNAADEKQKRQEDAAYWDAIYNKNKERDAEDRAADEAYWDNIYKENEARKSGDTTTTSNGDTTTLYNKETGRKWEGASNLAFGLLSSGGYYTEEEEEEKKKKKKK